MINQPIGTILALDVGERRIGVAVGNTTAKLAQPLTTINGGEKALERLVELAEDHGASALVVGLPRGLNSQETPQTSATREFIDLLKKRLLIPVYYQDEALTSKQAEQEFKTRRIRYNKADVDALAATYILEDFFRDNPG